MPKQGKTRLETARQRQTLQARARQDNSRQDKMGLEKGRENYAMQDKAIQVKAWQNKARPEQARRGKTGFVRQYHSLCSQRDGTRLYVIRQDKYCLLVPLIVKLISTSETWQVKARHRKTRKDRTSQIMTRQSKARQGWLVSWCFEPSQLQRRGKTR